MSILIQEFGSVLRSAGTFLPTLWQKAPDAPDAKNTTVLRLGRGGDIPVAPPVAMVLCMVGGYGVGWATGMPGHFLFGAPTGGGGGGGGLLNRTPPCYRMPLQIGVALSMLLPAARVKRACVQALDQVGTKPAFNQVTRIANTGPYASCRNPMYWATLSIPGALGVLLDSAWIAFGSTLVLWMYLHWVVVPAEESYLSKQLGESYEKYCASVKRWGFF